jgi:hypothetical protein
MDAEPLDQSRRNFTVSTSLIAPPKEAAAGRGCACSCGDAAQLARWMMTQRRYSTIELNL